MALVFFFFFFGGGGGGGERQTVQFAFDGTDYEIDLNAKNAAAFGKQLAPYIEHARRAGRAQPRRPGRTAAGRQRSGISGPGQKSTAWRSASAGASRPAWQSSTTPRPTGASTSHHRRDQKASTYIKLLSTFVTHVDRRLVEDQPTCTGQMWRTLRSYEARD